MSTKAKLTRCEVSKARLIYPFSKADVTDSSGFILIGYQKDKNYALTGTLPFFSYSKTLG